VPNCIRVKRDGLKTTDTWDENLWQFEILNDGDNNDNDIK
jgi:hypothetical protein